jgi:hypothetical protein
VHKLNDKGKQIRGFSAMPLEQRRAISSLGGKASRGGGRPPGSANRQKDRKGSATHGTAKG